MRIYQKAEFPQEKVLWHLARKETFQGDSWACKMRCIQKEETGLCAGTGHPGWPAMLTAEADPGQATTRGVLSEKPSKRDGKVNGEGTLEKEGRQAMENAMQKTLKTKQKK